MNEFEQKDYEAARDYADAIQNNADNIMSIFDDIDGVMNNLYGSNWESSGAENAHERYNELRRNYEIFYNDVVAMKTHIYEVTVANEEADLAASQSVQNI